MCVALWESSVLMLQKSATKITCNSGVIASITTAQDVNEVASHN